MLHLKSNNKPHLFGLIFSSILLSSASSQAHLPGFDKDLYMQQHGAQVEYIFDKFHHFESSEEIIDGKSPISLETLEKDALNQGRSWLYGLPSFTMKTSEDSDEEKLLSINLREVARINPEILNTFRELLPDADLNTDEGKGLFYTFLQEMVLATAYEVDPLAPFNWVEGVSPTFDWVKVVNEASADVLEKYKGRTGYALFLQTQERDRRLAEVRKTHPTITARQLWAIDIISAQFSHLDVKEITDLVATADPNRFKSADEISDEYLKLPKEALVRKQALHKINSDNEDTGYMGQLQKLEREATSQRFTKGPKNTKGVTKESRNFAIKEHLSYIRDYLLAESKAIESEPLGTNLSDRIVRLESTFATRIASAKDFIRWLNGGTVAAPVGANAAAADQTAAIYTEQLLESTRRLEAWKPKNFLSKIVTRKLEQAEELSNTLFLKGIRNVASDLDLAPSYSTLSPEDAERHIKTSSKQHLYKVESSGIYGNQKVATALNYLNIDKKKGGPARYSNLFIMTDISTAKWKFSFFVASRGSHTYIVYMDGESQPSSSSSATAKSSPSTASPKGRSTPHKGKGGGRRR